MKETEEQGSTKFETGRGVAGAAAEEEAGDAADAGAGVMVTIEAPEVETVDGVKEVA
jgi:hypothetical protein